MLFVLTALFTTKIPDQYKMLIESSQAEYPDTERIGGLLQETFCWGRGAS